MIVPCTVVFSLLSFGECCCHGWSLPDSQLNFNPKLLFQSLHVSLDFGPHIWDTRGGKGRNSRDVWASLHGSHSPPVALCALDYLGRAVKIEQQQGYSSKLRPAVDGQPAYSELAQITW